MENMYLT